LHTGLAVGQSLFMRHSTHRPSVAQSFPVALAQSAFAWHCTQTEFIVSQTGVLPEQLDDEVQPAMQLKVAGLQMGFAAPQSLLFRHATHAPAGSQRGAVAGQSESAAQPTQLSVALLQILVLPVQSLLAMHPMQAPLPVSHVGLTLGQSEFAVHDVWHA
jgi:hypothetical protein